MEETTLYKSNNSGCTDNDNHEMNKKSNNMNCPDNDDNILNHTPIRPSGNSSTTTTTTTTGNFQSLSVPEVCYDSSSGTNSSNTLNNDDDDNNNHHHHHHKSTNTFSLSIGLLLIILPWIPCYSITHVTTQQFRNEILQLQEEQYRLLADLKKTTVKVQTLNNEASEIEQTNNELLRDLKIHGDDVDTHTNRYRVAEEREESLLKRIDAFHEAIQKRSKEIIKERWGKDSTFQIEVTVKSSQVEWNIGNSFVIETAPVSVMPHAICHFLKMVDLQLWDGLTMVNRAGTDAMGTNVLQVTTLNAETAEWEDERFVQANLTQMAFTEYSEEFLPEKYTVAFAGRPGGPDFYINMDVFDEEYGEDGESVFGMVVDGREVLDSILGRALQRKKTNTVAIETVRLLY